MPNPASSFRSSSIAAVVNCYANINVRLLCMTGLKDDACVYFPTGVCPVVPDIHFKDFSCHIETPKRLKTTLELLLCQCR